MRAFVVSPSAFVSASYPYLNVQRDCRYRIRIESINLFLLSFFPPRTGNVTGAPDCLGTGQVAESTSEEELWRILLCYSGATMCFNLCVSLVFIRWRNLTYCDVNSILEDKK